MKPIYKPEVVVLEATSEGMEVEPPAQKENTSFCKKWDALDEKMAKVEEQAEAMGRLVMQGGQEKRDESIEMAGQFRTWMEEVNNKLNEVSTGLGASIADIQQGQAAAATKHKEDMELVMKSVADLGSGLQVDAQQKQVSATVQPSR